MMKSILSVVAVVWGVSGWIAISAADPPAPDERALVKANNQFAVELYGQIRDKAGNTFLSPYSISTALQ